MATSYYFYDLETSGFRASTDRIMQFAGQRTDEKLNLISSPDNFLIKLPPDILPTPSAVLFTGLSIKENQASGTSEPDFATYFNDHIALPSTVFIGFNNIRFDDEFIRYLLYRNFYDPYTWHWADNRSRWDILDPIRMTRALRPDGIIWPKDIDGNLTNRLEELTKFNKIAHLKAHDALSDVLATIEVARLVLTKQPKLFSYLIRLRDKKLSNDIINSKQPFVYTSGRYSSEFLHTSVVLTMEFNLKSSAAQVYDLRVDPEPILKMSAKDLADRWRYDPDKPKESLPIKTIKLNRCPAVAPISVLDPDSLKRLKLDMDTIMKNAHVLKENIAELNKKLKEVVGILDAERDYRQRSRLTYADQQLYSGFISPPDQKICQQVHAIPPPDIKFSSKRLNDLYFIYKARNYPKVLTTSENQQWHKLVYNRLFKGSDSTYLRFMEELKGLKKDSPNKALIKELEDYAKKVESEYGKLLPELDASQSVH